MKSVLFFLIPTILVSLFSSCAETIVTRKNNEEDIKLGVDANERFYRYLKRMNVDSMLKMFDTTSIKTDDTKKIISKINATYGNLISVEPLNATSYVEKRNNRITQMLFEIIVKSRYEKGQFNESMSIQLVDGELKINGYHFELLFE